MITDCRPSLFQNGSNCVAGSSRDQEPLIGAGLVKRTKCRRFNNARHVRCARLRFVGFMAFGYSQKSIETKQVPPPVAGDSVTQSVESADKPKDYILAGVFFRNCGKLPLSGDGRPADLIMSRSRDPARSRPSTPEPRFDPTSRRGVSLCHSVRRSGGTAFRIARCLLVPCIMAQPPNGKLTAPSSQRWGPLLLRVLPVAQRSSVMGRSF
jgi:hypothetical protein